MVSQDKKHLSLKKRSDNVKSIEEMARIQEKKKAERWNRKQLKRKGVGEVTGESSVPLL